MKNRLFGQDVGRICAVAVILVMTLGVSRPAESRRRGNPKKTIKKIGPYIYGLNVLSKNVRHSYRFYTTNLRDKKAGPTCRERGISLGHVRAKPACKSIKRASRNRPRLRTLEKAGKRYCKAAYILKKITGKLSSYYTTRAYRLDKCKKARRHHPKLMRAFTAFFKADAIIRQEVDRIQKDVDVARRKQLRRRYGRNMRYYHHTGPREARRVLRLARAEMGARAPNATRVVKAVLGFERQLIQMDKVVRKHKRNASRSGFQSYVTYLKIYSRALLGFTKKLRQGRPRSVKYSWKRVIAKFNRMIAHSNRVHFKKRMR
jgi:Protein of unknown function (DUF3829)